MDDVSSNVSVLSEFFTTQSTAGDLNSVLSDTSLLFQIVVVAIMFIGAICLAIWLIRLGIDIFLIVTRGFGGEGGARSKMAGWGTAGEAQAYSNLGTYFKKTLFQIILVILIIALFMTGMMYQVIAYALDFVGTVSSKLFGLDLGTKLSSLDAESFVENIGSQRSNSLRNQYDEQLSASREASNQLYDYAKDGTVDDDPKLNEMKSQYTQSMVKANILGEELMDRDADKEFKLGDGYFQQHLRQDGDGVCNEEFLLEDVIDTFNVGGADADVTCE